jgi:hypothetical protein
MKIEEQIALENLALEQIHNEECDTLYFDDWDLKAYIDDNYKSNSVTNGAYHERNMLIAVLSKLPMFVAYRAWDETQDFDWKMLVVLEYTNYKKETKQFSWHIHASETNLFNHLNFDPKYKWDGHTTEEKYENLLDLNFRNHTDEKTN